MRYCRPGSENDKDEYWRINLSNSNVQHLRYAIHKHGYPSSSSVAKLTLLRYANRVERNLLCYHRCTDEQLKQYAKARHV